MADNKFLPKLSQNLLEMMKDDEYYDITIEVGKDPYIKVFRAHMVLLYYRSPYLRRILSTSNRKNDGTLVHIKLPNILPEIFQIILKYIYGGKLSLDTYDTLDIIKILRASSELSLRELIIYLQAYLIENKASWMEQNFILINQTSFEHDSFSKLQKFCTNLMSKEPEKIFKSLDFVSIPEKSLVTLIQNDNLQMSEVQVWEYVLKWGLAQNPELSSDPSSYSENDFNTLKNSLKQCIPLIRFYNLTSKEFLDRVFPYKKLLPEDLYDELIKYFLNPKSKPNNILEPRGIKKASIDSEIITNKHVELISKWIKKIDTTGKSATSYEFKLMLRGSCVGFTGNTFHEICDNQPHTVSLIKVKGSSEILGGYNPIEWKSKNSNDRNRFSVTRSSFIFSFKDKENIDNYILSRVRNEKCAINNWFESGPSFGLSDLAIFSFSDISYCKKSDYENPIRGSDYFSIEEYEVFQIIQT